VVVIVSLTIFNRDHTEFYVVDLRFQVQCMISTSAQASNNQQQPYIGQGSLCTTVRCSSEI
jgi:hypothetical protein